MFYFYSVRLKKTYLVLSLIFSHNTIKIYIKTLLKILQVEIGDI